MLSLPPDCLALILNTMSFMGANFVVEWNSTNEVGVADCMTNQGAHGGLSSDGSSDTSRDLFRGWGTMGFPPLDLLFPPPEIWHNNVNRYYKPSAYQLTFNS